MAQVTLDEVLVELGDDADETEPARRLRSLELPGAIFTRQRRERGEKEVGLNKLGEKN